MLVNKQSVFKLCDFGISRVMRASQSIAIGPVQGTEVYIPVGDLASLSCSSLALDPSSRN